MTPKPEPIWQNKLALTLCGSIALAAGNAVLEHSGNAKEKTLNTHQQNSLWFRVEQLETSNLSLSNEVYLLKNPPKKGKRP